MPYNNNALATIQAENLSS